MTEFQKQQTITLMSKRSYKPHSVKEEGYQKSYLWVYEDEETGLITANIAKFEAWIGEGSD